MASRRRPVSASIVLLAGGMALAAPGSLDPEFGTDGLVSEPVGQVPAASYAILQQADGSLVLAGAGNDDGGFDDDMLVVRLNGDGSLDRTFGINGVAGADFDGSHDFAWAVIQQPDGKIVVAGGSWRDGSIAIAGGPRQDGRIVIAGASQQAGPGYDLALARFNANGTLDSTFGNGGRVAFDLGGDDEWAAGLVRQDGGKLVVAGRSNASGSYRTVFARLNADGTLDPTFGSAGETWIDFGDGSHNWASALAQQPDGKLVSVGAVYGPDPLRFDMAVVRLTADGISDGNFSDDGLLVVDVEGLGDEALSVAIQPDGRIVAAGYSVQAGDNPANAALIRLDDAGSLDPDFGAAGKVVVDLGNHEVLRAVVVLADGKIAATGLRTTAVRYPDVILARFTASGALDKDFGDSGVAIADFGDPDIASASVGMQLAQQTDGKLAAAVLNYRGVVSAARFDDGAAYPGRIGLINNLYFVDEDGTASVDYIVRRTGGSTGDVSVNYAVIPGQAQPGADYVDAAGTLTWSDGDYADKTVTVDIINDSLPESREDFTLRLSDPTGGSRLATDRAATSVYSADGPGQIGFFFAPEALWAAEPGGLYEVYVVRYDGSQGAVSVQFETKSGSATAGSDFEPTSGTLSWDDGESDLQTIYLTILDDATLEGVEIFELRLAGATGGASIAASYGTQVMAISDDERGFLLVNTSLSVGEAGGSVSLAVSRVGDLTGAVSVSYSTASGAATEGADFLAESGTFDWAHGDGSDRNIVVNLTNDSTDEENESFTVSLSNPSDGMLLAPDSSATVTITDDDSSGGGGGGGGGSGSGGGGGVLSWPAVLWLGILSLLRRRRCRVQMAGLIRPSTRRYELMPSR